jgi:selenocysteine-specific translation elongation factor
MPNLTVAVIGEPGYVKDLGKPGTISDITFYNLHRGDATVTLIEPSRYPERLASLYYAVSLADFAIVIVDAIDQFFGEEVLMLTAAGIKQGLIIPHNYLSPEDIAPMIRGTVLENYEWPADDRPWIRELLLQTAEKKALPAASALPPGAVPVDHAFPVKGLGTVALGCVVRGMIRKHEDLRLLPTGKTAHLRSIQKHDVDSDVAYPGDRVGLALKGIEASDIDRGFVFTRDPQVTSSGTITGKGSLLKYWPSPLREGMVVSIGHWMQFLPARIAFIDNSGDWRSPSLTFRTDKQLVYVPGDKAIIHYLEGGKLRIVGIVTIN